MKDDKEQILIDLKNEMERLDKNIKTLEEMTKKLSFLLNEIRYELKVEKDKDE